MPVLQDSSYQKLYASKSEQESLGEETLEIILGSALYSKQREDSMPLQSLVTEEGDLLILSLDLTNVSI